MIFVAIIISVFIIALFVIFINNQIIDMKDLTFKHGYEQRQLMINRIRSKKRRNKGV
jgi:hypothetical protein